MTYRVRKYVARHRGAVTATALLLLGLFAAMGYGLWQQRQAAIAGNEAQATAQFLNWMITSSNVMYGGRNDMTVRELVERIHQRLLQPSALSPATVLHLQSSLGLYLFTAGDPGRGLQVATLAMDGSREIENPHLQLGAISNVGLMESMNGKCPEAVRLFQDAETIYQRVRHQTAAFQHAAYLTSYSQVVGACQGDRQRELELLTQASSFVRQIPDDSKETSVPAPVLKSLFYVGYSMALSRQQRFAEARAALAEGIREAGDNNPDTRAARIALLRAEAAVAYNEKDIQGAVTALQRASETMVGYVSAFEYHRIRMMLANRLAESGDRDRAAAVIDESLSALESIDDTRMGGPRWMVLVDAAFGEMRVNRCASTLNLVARADALAGGSMPPQWRGNRLAAEAFCRDTLHQQPAARRLATEAIQQYGAAGITASSVIQRLTALRDRAEDAAATAH